LLCLRCDHDDPHNDDCCSFRETKRHIFVVIL
jgi:hypothetical protein